MGWACFALWGRRELGDLAYHTRSIILSSGTLLSLYLCWLCAWLPMCPWHLDRGEEGTVAPAVVGFLVVLALLVWGGASRSC